MTGRAHGFPETGSVLSRVKSRYCDLGTEHKREGEEEINENHYQSEKGRT